MSAGVWGPSVDWMMFTPAQAAALKLDLVEHTVISAPVNEMGERCPWPWDPQQLGGVPLGMYHCPYCGGMVVAGMVHLDHQAMVPEDAIDREFSEYSSWDEPS